MVLLAVLAMAASATPPPPRVAAERQAVAMVRILPGAPLRFAEIERTAPQTLRNAQIRNPDGSLEPARLAEFQ